MKPCLRLRPALQGSLPLLLVLCAILAGGCESQRERLPAVNQPFPDLRLQGIGRSDVKLTDLRGRTVVLNIWAPWCGPCIAEMPSLESLSRALAPERYAVIGLTVDDRFLAEEFMHSHGIEFANYVDVDRRQVEGALGVRYFPQTFIIAPDGVLIARVDGYREWSSEELMGILDRRATERSVELPAEDGGAADD